MLSVAMLVSVYMSVVCFLVSIAQKEMSKLPHVLMTAASGHGSVLL